MMFGLMPSIFMPVAAIHALPGAIATPPEFLSSASQSAVSGTPYAIELLTNEPCTITIIGGADAALFDIGGNTAGAVSLPAGTYSITIRITSNATGLYIDVPLTITAAASAGAGGYQFLLESGDAILREDGGSLFLEEDAPTSSAWALETYDRFLLESGDLLLQEAA